MKSSTIQKVNTLGKVGAIITKICCILTLIAAVASLVAGILCALIPKDAVTVEFVTSTNAFVQLDPQWELSEYIEADNSGFIDLGGNRYQIIFEAEDDILGSSERVFHLQSIMWLFFLSVPVCVAAYIAFRAANKLCVRFQRCETPFTEEISNSMTKLAWCIIPFSILNGSIGDCIMIWLTTGRFELTLAPDIVTILLVLCIFMISFVFKHGIALQAESDETL